MRRAGQPEHERRDFYLFIDEFQNFTTDSFEAILAEARKYRLCLTLSHQYVDQIPLPIRQAVFGNVGTLFSFRVGNTKAEVGNHPRLFLKNESFCGVEIPQVAQVEQLGGEGRNRAAFGFSARSTAPFTTLAITDLSCDRHQNYL